MRNFPIVSLSSVEDTLSESSVLPLRGIKKGRKDLGEILFFHPLTLTNLSALCSFLCFSLLPPTLWILILRGVILIRILVPLLSHLSFT